MSAVWLAGWLVCAAAQVKDEERYLYVTKVKMEEAKNARRQSQKAKQVCLLALRLMCPLPSCPGLAPQ